MNEMMKMVFSLSLSGTLLMFLLLLLRPLYKERLSKGWQYYIWLVVVVRLLFPWTPDSSLVGNICQSVAQEVDEADMQGMLQDATQDTMQNNSQDVEQIESQPEKWNVLQTLAEIIRFLVQKLPLIWLVTALLLFVRKVTIYQSFAQYLQAGSIAINEISLLEQVGEAMRQNHIKGAVGLYANSLIASPLLIGFFRPRIVLPSPGIAKMDFHYTVLHELTHYKRGDMFYKWLVQIVLCLHWFNPFVYWMERKISRACELSCDEAVIRKLDATARREYGAALLNAMGMGGPYKNLAAPLNFNESKELLKGRLEAIMKYKEKTKSTKAVAIALAFLFVIGALLAGAYKAPTAASAANKAASKKTYAEKDYAKNKITKKGSTYYYKGKRIRIFMDLAADGSFVVFNYDQKGKIDLRLQRANNGSISKIEYLTEEEAREILSDMDFEEASSTGQSGKSDRSDKADKADKVGASSSAAIERLSKDEVSSSVAKAIKSCKAKKWYVISKNGVQYVYYSGLPKNYAFQPEISTDKVKINISDIGKTSGNYVLLAVRKNVPITIYYNNAKISYKKIKK